MRHLLPAVAFLLLFGPEAADSQRPDTATSDTLAADTLARPDTTSPPPPPVRPLPLADADAHGGSPLPLEVELIVGGSLHALSAPLRWDGGDWTRAGAAVGVVGLASLLDEAGRDLMARRRTDRNTRIEEAVEPFGAVRSLEILGGMLFAGVVLDDRKLRATAAEGLASSLVAAGIITPTLQKVIGRAKPREGLPANTFDPFSGYHSFPSGHTTQAFAVASVIAAEYPHPAVQIGSYGLATAVGVSRMYRRSHFLSDVVGAGIIGTTVGRSVARWGQARHDTVRLLPTVIDRRAYLILSVPI